jgi:hypothetical protein
MRSLGSQLGATTEPKLSSRGAISSAMDLNAAAVV